MIVTNCLLSSLGGLMQSSSRARAGVGLLGLSSLITGLDFTIVYVALPDIQRELTFTDRQVQWVVSAYALVFGGFLLLFGRLSDLVGRRRVFQLGMALFLVASLAGAAATGPAVLLAARGVQGLGAAALFPSTLALVTSTFPQGHRRSRAMTIWAASGASGLSLGALLGGVLAEISWRGVFLVNVPLAAIALAGAPALFSRDTAPTRRGGFDVMGACTGTAAAVLLVLSITEASEPDASWAWVLACTAITLALALLFFRAEATNSNPLLPLALFSHRSLRGALLLITLYGISLQSVPYVLTIHLRDGLGMTALEAGLAFLLPTGAIAAGNITGERLMLRFGIRVVLVTGLVTGAAGTGLMAAAIDARYPALAPGILLAGLGMGLVFPAMFAAATTGIPPAHAGIASATASTGLQIGTAVGLAIITWILHAGDQNLVAALAAISGIAVAAILPVILVSHPTQTGGTPDDAPVQSSSLAGDGDPMPARGSAPLN
ncbi:MFS transporter [Micromonospora globbae]|uniref:MFS transporter n=1 Tax=Micromonospora globbae TaxID=1894969 RepID=UPI0037902A22